MEVEAEVKGPGRAAVVVQAWEREQPLHGEDTKAHPDLCPPCLLGNKSLRLVAEGQQKSPRCHSEDRLWVEAQKWAGAWGGKDSVLGPDQRRSPTRAMAGPLSTPVPQTWGHSASLTVKLRQNNRKCPANTLSSETRIHH